MECVYLGLFQKVFEWVLKNIFGPVFSFVSNLLTTVLTWVFEELLAPILLPILQDVLNFFIDLWKLMYSRQLYLLFSGLLKLIDYLEKAFDVFIGLTEVTYQEADGSEISGTLVEVLMQQKTISTVFWAITLGALGLALILTIYATAKSAFDLDFENKRPVSKVLAAMMKTFVQFFTVPFFVYFLLKLSAVILNGVVSIFNLEEETTLGRIVFTIASLDAARQESYNLSTAAADVTVGVTDSVRAPFYRLTGSGLKDYGRMIDVDEVFYLEKFDYLIGFIAAVFLLFTIGVCLIVFVQRIFELLLLYLASPYFVCMIPLDEGERFARWREMFVAKCFTGFGSVVGMRLFLLVCPLIMGGRIQFGETSSPEMDYMMKLFFIAGGAWAVYKSGPMITSLLSSQAGASEAATAATVGGLLYSYTAGKLIAKGQQGLSTALRGRGGGMGAGMGAGLGAGGAEGGPGKKGNGRFTGLPGGMGAAVSRRPGGMSGPGRPGGMSGAGRPMGMAGPGRPGGMFGPGRPVGIAGPGRPGGMFGPGRPMGMAGPGRPMGMAGPGRPVGMAGPGRPGGIAGPGRSRSMTRPGRLDGTGSGESAIRAGRQMAGAGYPAGRAGAGPKGQGRMAPPGYGGVTARPGVMGRGAAGIPGYSGLARYGSRLDGGTVRPGVTGRNADGSQTYAPASVDVFASAAARQGQAGTVGAYRGGPAGSYRWNAGGSTYTVGQGGQVLSRQFPGSALGSGVTVSRGGSGYTAGSYGRGASGAPASSYGSTSGAPSGRYGGGGSVSPASSYSNTSVGQSSRYGGGRSYQVTPARVPVASVRGGASSPQVRYQDISIKGLAHDKGPAGGTGPARSRRDTI